MSVELVIDLLPRRWTVTHILREHDHVTREDIDACLAHAPGELPDRGR